MLCLCTIITFDVTLLINISITLACKYTRTYVLVIVFATGSDVILFINPCFFFFSYMPICTSYLWCWDDVPFYRIVDDFSWPDASIINSVCVPSYAMRSLYRNANGCTKFNNFYIDKFVKCHRYTTSHPRI